MFDYENIGGKIKNLTKLIFIIEAIGIVIIGLVFLSRSDSLTLSIIEVLVLFFGLAVAWVGSWLLYAFGELVEKTSDNENNTRQILKKLNEEETTLARINTLGKDISEHKWQCDETTSAQTNAVSKNAHAHQWRCDGCGNMRTQSPCEYCGKE